MTPPSGSRKGLLVPCRGKAVTISKIMFLRGKERGCFHLWSVAAGSRWYDEPYTVLSQLLNVCK